MELENRQTETTEQRTRTYQPQPVRRVSIPKPDGGERHLGILAVRDRVVQQLLLDTLQLIFDPHFHPSSYGYRPGRSCQQAVAKATMFIRQYGLRHVVDMDLSKCFDRLDHELIIASIRRRVTDGSILNLIRMFLTSGVRFLGVEIGLTWTQIQVNKVAAFKNKVRQITRRNSPVNLAQVIADLNPVLRGFSNYSRMANCKGAFAELAGWIRRRLRAKQLALWKKSDRLHRRLRQLGYRGEFMGMRMRSWRSSSSHLAHWAIPDVWLSELGLFDLASVPTGVLPQVT